MIRYILTDIEGTTTPITFVHDVLFPYAAARLDQFVDGNRGDETIEHALSATKRTMQEELGRDASDDDAIAMLLEWIDKDRKHPALKTLQGLIWRHGYESGAYVASVYDDVEPMLRKWHEHGVRLGVYSSGSVAAQKLLFKYTAGGDLTPLFSDYFDTAVGAKRDAAAYAHILKDLRLSGGEVLFLSDVAEELDAAAMVGMATTQLVRPGTVPTMRHQIAKDFTDVDRMLS